MFILNKKIAIFIYFFVDENSFPNEWEAIPHLSMLDINTPTQQQIMSQQQASSIAGGLVNNAVASVTSIWRGWAKR